MSQSCEPGGTDPAQDLPVRPWGRLWRRLWRAGTSRHAAEALYQAVVKQARTPVLFREIGVPDTPEGRFEMIALHTALVLRRLRREGDRGQGIGQELFDLMFADMDSSLREVGVSDLSVGKYVKRLAGNFYARLASLDEALADAGPAETRRDARTLHPMLRSNIYHGGAVPSDCQVVALADYLVALDQAMVNQEGEALCQGIIAWVAPGKPPKAGQGSAGSG